MKIIKQFLFAVIILFCTMLNAQKSWPYENNLNSYKAYFKDTYRVDILLPKEFNSLNIYNVGFKVSKYPKKPTGSAFATFFLSKDKNCIIALPFRLFELGSLLPKQKNIDTTLINTFIFLPKTQIINEIKIPLELYYHSFWSDNDKNKEVTFDVYKYADFIFGRKAREKYNADAYSISDIPKTDEFEFFSLRGQSIENLPVNKFSFITSLFIQKGEKALDIKFFFTEKGFKKKEKYINMLDKHIWFDENFKPN